MRLRDQVEVLAATRHEDRYGDVWWDWDLPTVVATVPAYVGYVTVDRDIDPGVNALIEELRAIVRAIPFDPNANRLRWRGQMYTNDGPPMVRRRNGVDHHLTIRLRAVT